MRKYSYPIWLEFIMYRVSLAIVMRYLLERNNRTSVFLIHLGSILLLATSRPNCEISQEVLLDKYMYQKMAIIGLLWWCVQFVRK